MMHRKATEGPLEQGNVETRDTLVVEVSKLMTNHAINH